MTLLVRLFLVALLSFSVSSNALADCGDCPGDKAAGHDHGADHAEGDKTKAACVCSKGKEGETVWCEACGAGYHEGKKMKCEGCFAKASGKSEKGCEKCSGGKKAEGEG